MGKIIPESETSITGVDNAHVLFTFGKPSIDGKVVSVTAAKSLCIMKVVTILSRLETLNLRQ